jgi:hypothetical protein
VCVASLSWQAPLPCMRWWEAEIVGRDDSVVVREPIVNSVYESRSGTQRVGAFAFFPAVRAELWRGARFSHDEARPSATARWPRRCRDHARGRPDAALRLPGAGLGRAGSADGARARRDGAGAAGVGDGGRVATAAPWLDRHERDRRASGARRRTRDAHRISAKMLYAARPR